MTNPKLLPCPFCGGKAVIRSYEDGWIVKCLYGRGGIAEGCDVEPRTLPMTTKEAAVKVWNTRPTNHG